MYGLIGRIVTHSGQREALAALLTGTGSMPGCLSYVVARDPNDENALYVTEVWDTQASHRGSLQLPEVQAAISRGRTMIAGMQQIAETDVVGGIGLPPA